MALIAPARVETCQETVRKLREGLNQILLGQEELIELVIVGFLAQGHILLEGLPGLGKTELVKGLARLLRLKFSRIQFTPDLLPADITGSPILEEDAERRRQFVFHPGPVFANVLLADEINRASPKTQSALLEAMQERRVTVLGTSHPLPSPFYVLATQNPIELEGTYPLPEAQVDRFTFKILVSGVGHSVLSRIVQERRRGAPPELQPVVDASELGAVLAAVDEVHIAPAVADYIGRLVAATHQNGEFSPDPVRKYVKYGASPRGAIALSSAARALAMAEGKPTAGFEQVRKVAAPALAHRLILDYAARLDGIDAVTLVRHVLDAVPELDRDLPKTIEAR